MAKKKKIDLKLKPKLDIAREALEENLKRLLRKHIPDAHRNYPAALVKRCPFVGLTSAKRYVGQLPDDYGYPALDVLIAMAESFNVSVFELLAGAHDAHPAHGEAHPDPSGGGGSNAGIIILN